MQKFTGLKRKYLQYVKISKFIKTSNKVMLASSFLLYLTKSKFAICHFYSLHNQHRINYVNTSLSIFFSFRMNFFVTMQQLNFGNYVIKVNMYYSHENMTISQEETVSWDCRW